MDVVEALFKELVPEQTKTPEAGSSPSGEYITKEELENVISKMSATIEEKLTNSILSAMKSQSASATETGTGAEGSNSTEDKETKI